MQYSTLGNTGLVVSRLSFGAMTFTAGNKSFATVYKTEEADAKSMVGRALDAGVNFFDTADGYAGGESELMLGRALRGHRTEVILTTKVGFRTGPALAQAGLNRRHIFGAIDQSLDRLGTDYVDLYLAHKEDPFTPLEVTLQALDEVVRSGKARYIGFSNWSAWRVAAAMELQRANGWAPFTHGQMTYSLLARDVEYDVLPMMKQYGLGLTVWSPLTMGFLSGKYTRENLSDKDNRISGFDLIPFDKEFGFTLVDRMRDIAARHKASVAQVALAWLLSKNAVSSVIVGASKPHQLDDNLGAANLQLGVDEITMLDEFTRLRPLYPHWYSEMTVDGPVKEALKARDDREAAFREG
jgi:aryl-alcohol dehydrogenase-like predicted oxidoreductase